jgi:hypothetical protein
MRHGELVQISARFFFPQELPLDAPGVNLDIEIVLYDGRQLNEAQRWFRFSLGYEERHHFRREFVTASGTSLQRDQPGQPSFLEGGIGLVKRGTGKSKLVGRLGNRPVVGMDLAKHLVLDLKQVVGVEEIAALEQRMAHILRASVERAVMP